MGTTLTSSHEHNEKLKAILKNDSGKIRLSAFDTALIFRFNEMFELFFLSKGMLVSYEQADSMVDVSIFLVYDNINHSLRALFTPQSDKVVDGLEGLNGITDVEFEILESNEEEETNTKMIRLFQGEEQVLEAKIDEGYWLANCQVRD